MTGLFLLLYGIIALPILVGLHLLFPVFKIVDLMTVELRWRWTMRIYEQNLAEFNKAMYEVAKQGGYLDDPPERPERAMTSLALLHYAIDVPFAEHYHLFEDEEEDL